MTSKLVSGSLITPHASSFCTVRLRNTNVCLFHNTFSIRMTRTIIITWNTQHSPALSLSFSFSQFILKYAATASSTRIVEHIAPFIGGIIKVSPRRIYLTFLPLSKCLILQWFIWRIVMYLLMFLFSFFLHQIWMKQSLSWWLVSCAVCSSCLQRKQIPSQPESAAGDFTY